MLDDVVGAYGSRFLLAAGGVGLALLLLILVLWVIRSRAPSPFVRGGRNRQPRLQVLDAPLSMPVAGWCWCAATTSSI